MKENKTIGSFIIEKLKYKIVTKRVLNSYDLYNLCYKMGVWRDDEIMERIINHLDENNIDINFNSVDKEFYDRYRKIESRIKMDKKFKNMSPQIKDNINRVMRVKIEQRPEWLEQYRSDDDLPQGVVDNTLDLMSEIVKKYQKKLTEQVENQTTPNILDILKEIE
jgi:hypothetical protein